MPALLGVAVAIAVSVLDVASRGRSGLFAGLVAIGPFVTAVLAGPVATSVVAALAVALAVALGVANGIFGTFGHGFEIAVVAAACALAVLLARQRHQAQRSLNTMRQIAEAVQRAIIPPVPERLHGLRLAARYESAIAGALVGGDFYEVVDTPFGVRAVVGDVCGKGLPAVRLAAKAAGSFATVAQLEAGLVAAVKAMEASLDGSLGEEDFITAVVVEFSADGDVTVVNCGHHPPLRLADGEAVLLEPPRLSLPLGFHDAPAPARFSLPPGSRLLLYTDGLVEARDRRGRMLSLLEDAGDALLAATVDEAADRLLSRLRRHTGGDIHDDVALLLAEACAP